MALRPFNVLSLCAGIGGLDLGVGLAVRGARTVCVVEREAFAVANLVHQMEAGRLDEAPIWSDVTTFKGRAWRGGVDLICGGYPCQPFSSAGKRRGADDPRHLWPHVRRIIRDSDAPMAFLENVRGHVTLGLRQVLEDLEADGFDAEWGVFRASDVGAPHQRARLFILAWRRGMADALRGRSPHMSDESECEQSGREVTVRDRWAGQGVGDADGQGLEGQRLDEPQSTGGREDAAGPVAEAGFPFFPPRWGDDGGWDAWLERFPGSEPAVRRGTHGASDRVDRLRALGNGVVPLQAATAFSVLSARMT